MRTMNEVLAEKLCQLIPTWPSPRLYDIADELVHSMLSSHQSIKAKFASHLSPGKRPTVIDIVDMRQWAFVQLENWGTKTVKKDPLTNAILGDIPVHEPFTLTERMDRADKIVNWLLSEVPTDEEEPVQEAPKEAEGTSLEDTFK